MAELASDKRHEPTPNRRQQARAQGHVARSQDLSSALLLLGSLVVLAALGETLAGSLAGFATRLLGGEPWLEADVPRAIDWFDTTMMTLVKGLLPVLLLITALGWLCGMAQTGLLFLPDKLAPDISRIDPFKGLGRLFSVSNAGTIGFGLLKIAVIGAVAVACVLAERDTILALAELEIPQLAAGTSSLLFWTAAKLAGALLVLALLDYLFQRWRHEHDLRMTSQELREELKNLQGDRQLVARRQALERLMIRDGLAALVPKSGVVIAGAGTAVVVEYDARTPRAPVLTAKGAGLVAERIRSLARERSVPIVENTRLAESLFRDVELEQEIPPETYGDMAHALVSANHAKAR